MTHDYEAALKRIKELEFTPEYETIRHALSEMARMQKENLVMVPREATEDISHSITSVLPKIVECEDATSEWFDETVKLLHESVIAASQEKKS